MGLLWSNVRAATGTLQIRLYAPFTLRRTDLGHHEFMELMDIHPDISERAVLTELVLEPLQQRGKFLYVFSRVRVFADAPGLRLWTSTPAIDEAGRSFVPFRVEQSTVTAPSVVTGCYYPRADAAFLLIDFMEIHVPVDQHPLLTMQLPPVSKLDKTLCRTAAREAE